MYQTLTTSELLKQGAIKLAIELNSKCNDTGEIDGFKITAEQCNAINAGEREAIDKFFKDNDKRLKRLAAKYLRNMGLSLYWDKKFNCYNPTVVEIDDCINQLYLDMRRGFLVFALVPRAIARVICHSFRYAGVGGFGDEDGAYLRGVV